jgi:prophage regulatory protein
MEQILRVRDVCRVTGLARSTIWRLERGRQFPARRKLGVRSVGWLASEVSEWLMTRALAIPARKS